MELLYSCLGSILHSQPLPKPLPPTFPAHFPHIFHTLPNTADAPPTHSRLLCHKFSQYSLYVCHYTMVNVHYMVLGTAFYAVHPIPCFICAFHLCISSVCFVCVFHLCVSPVYFICVFHLCVSSARFICVFHLRVSSVYLLYPP